MTGTGAPRTLKRASQSQTMHALCRNRPSSILPLVKIYNTLHKKWDFINSSPNGKQVVYFHHTQKASRCNFKLPSNKEQKLMSLWELCLWKNKFISLKHNKFDSRSPKQFTAIQNAIPFQGCTQASGIYFLRSATINALNCLSSHYIIPVSALYFGCALVYKCNAFLCKMYFWHLFLCSHSGSPSHL